MTSTNEPVNYTDHHGTNLEKIWCVVIKNLRNDRAALNTIAILDGITDIADGRSWKPDTTFLKWAGQQVYQKTIFPNDSAKVDAFALIANENGVFLHSASDVYPKKPVISSLGTYILTYILYADSFPVVRFNIRINYRGPIVAATELRDSATDAILES